MEHSRPSALALQEAWAAEDALRRCADALRAKGRARGDAGSDDGQESPLLPAYGTAVQTLILKWQELFCPAADCGAASERSC